MDIIDFVGMNIIIIGTTTLVVFIYLVFLINKRRKAKFLHHVEGEKDKNK